MRFLEPGERAPVGRYASDLEIDVAVREAWVGVTVRGDLDGPGGRRLEDVVDRIPRVSGPRLVLVDAADVGFVDAAGVRALLRVRDALESRGMKWRFDGRSRRLRRVLELTGAGPLLADPAWN